MDTVRSFDDAKSDVSPYDETSTMGDPRSEGRGLVVGALFAVVFWTGVAAVAWWFLG